MSILNRYIKRDILSHLNNRKLYQSLLLLNKKEKKDFISINKEKMTLTKLYLEGCIDIKFPIEICIYSTCPTDYCKLINIKSINELLKFVFITWTCDIWCDASEAHIFSDFKNELHKIKNVKKILNYIDENPLFKSHFRPNYFFMNMKIFYSNDDLFTSLDFIHQLYRG